MEFYRSAVWRIEIAPAKKERSLAAAMTRAHAPSDDDVLEENALFILSQAFPQADDIEAVVLMSGRSMDDVVSVEMMADVFVPDWIMSNVKGTEEEEPDE